MNLAVTARSWPLFALLVLCIPTLVAGELPENVCLTGVCLGMSIDALSRLPLKFAPGSDRHFEDDPHLVPMLLGRTVAREADITKALSDLMSGELDMAHASSVANIKFCSHTRLDGFGIGYFHTSFTSESGYLTSVELDLRPEAGGAQQSIVVTKIVRTYGVQRGRLDELRQQLRQSFPGLFVESRDVHFDSKRGAYKYDYSGGNVGYGTYDPQLSHWARFNDQDAVNVNPKATDAIISPGLVLEKPVGNQKQLGNYPGCPEQFKENPPPLKIN